MKHTKTNFLKMLLVIGVAGIIVYATVACFRSAFSSTMDGVQWEQENYCVESGDTLWSIGATYCPNGVDVREWIEEVKEINGLSNSMIYPRDRLIVLVPVA